MSLESSKTLGGIGAILLAIPFLNLVGIILVLIAMKGMSEYYEDEGIFKNALYGFVLGFIGVIGLIVFILMFALGFAGISSTISPDVVQYSGFAFVIVVLIVQYAFSLISAIFYKRSLDSLSITSKENIFSTSGVILLVGAIIPIIGEILKFIAWILAAVGFFSIKELKQSPTEAEPNLDSEKRFCTNCGAPLKPGSIFCQKCGKKIE
jgi:uncharacterized membrane protein